MRFLVDECIEPTVIRWLRECQHDVRSIYEEARGSGDDEILREAFSDNRILITADKDFGEIVFREGKPHKGVILLRLQNKPAISRIEVLGLLLEHYADQLSDNFIVVTESAVRIARG